jgi:hypothetical protein
MAEIAAGIVISILISTATTLVSNALQPNNEASRLSDINPLRASFGENLPYVWGEAKLPGTIFWNRELEEYVYEKQYRYKGTCAVAFARNLVGFPYTFKRVFGNKRTMFDATNATSNKYNISFRDGDNTSKVSAMVSVEGNANVPLFKQLNYIVMASGKLTNFGQSFPNFEAIIATYDVPPLSKVLTDVCTLAGLPSTKFAFNDHTFFNTTLVQSAVLRNDGSTYKSFIEELQIVYNFSVREVNGIVEFTPTVSTFLPTVTLNAGQIGCQPATQGTETGESADDSFNLYTRQEEAQVDVPTIVQLEFYNRANRFRKSNSNYAEVTQTTEFTRTVTVSNVGLDSTEAAGVASRNFAFARATTNRFSGITTPYIHANSAIWASWTPAGFNNGLLIPGNPYNIPLTAVSTTQQVQSAELSTTFIVKSSSHDYINGANFVTSTPPTEVDTPEALTDNEGVPVIVETSPMVTVSPTLGNTAAIHFQGGVIKTGAANFAQGEAFYELGSSDFSTGLVPDMSSVGTLTSSLPVSDPMFYDESSVFTVSFPDTTPTYLTNLSTDEWLDNKQVLLMQTTGELVLVRNATLTSPGVYSCSGLIRGWQGTDTNMQVAPSGSSVYILKAIGLANSPTRAMNNLTASQATAPIGVSRYHKMLDLDVDEVSYNSTLGINYSFTGRSLKPFAPAIADYYRNGANNDVVNILAAYRSRGFFSNDFNPPVNEATIEFVLEAYTNSTYSTTTYTSPSQFTNLFQYPLTQWASFGNTTTLKVYFKLFSISSVVGRGFSYKYVYDLTTDVISLVL